MNLITDQSAPDRFLLDNPPTLDNLHFQHVSSRFARDRYTVFDR
jgi:hypothetical protein